MKRLAGNRNWDSQGIGAWISRTSSEPPRCLTSYFSFKVRPEPIDEFGEFAGLYNAGILKTLLRFILFLCLDPTARSAYKRTHTFRELLRLAKEE
jgi:hypothetical protein